MSYQKGSLSKTHPGDFDFTTKKGDKVFHRRHHYVRRSRKPYTNTKSKSGGRRTRRRKHKRTRRH
jgi:hypothetical protein